MPDAICTALDAFRSRCQLQAGHEGKHHREFREGSWSGSSDWNDMPFKGELRELAIALSDDHHAHLLDERSLRALERAHAALTGRAPGRGRGGRRG